MPPAQQLELLEDDSEEIDLFTREGLGAVVARGRGGGAVVARGRGSGAVVARGAGEQSESGAVAGLSLALGDLVVAAPAGADEVQDGAAERPEARVRNITRAQRATCFERFVVENMSGRYLGPRRSWPRSWRSWACTHRRFSDATESGPLRAVEPSWRAVRPPSARPACCSGSGRCSRW
jgi:hypothetical protein